MNKNTIGTNLKKLREERGLTQTMLAIMAGYSNSSTIAKIEKGLVAPGTLKAAAIARALRVPIEAILGQKVDDDAILIEAYHSATIGEKMGIKMILRIPLTKEEVAEAVKNNYDMG